MGKYYVTRAGGLKYVTVGDQGNYGVSFYLYLKDFPTQQDFDEYIEFPTKGQIQQTGKKTYILLPGDCWIFDVYVECGYRGDSKFQIKEPADYQAIEYCVFHSPVGSLGVASGALVVVNTDKVVLEFQRTGRLRGMAKYGIKIYTLDGVEEIPNLTYEEYLSLR